MKIKLLYVVFFTLIFSFLFPTSLFAVPVTAVESPTLLDSIIANFKASGTAWEPIFQKIAKRIFFFLAAVQIAIELGVMAAKGELEIGGVAVTLGRMMLIFGIFWAALETPTYFLQWYNDFDSLANSANAAAGAGGTLGVGKMFGASANLLGYGVSNLSVWDVGKSLGILFISLVATILIVLIAVEFIILTLKFYFLMYVNIIILAFAPFTHTRQWAINGVTNLLKAGLEVLMIKLIIGLTITAILKYVDDTIAGEDTSLVYLLIFIIAVFALSKMIHPMVESFFSGYSAQNNSMGQRMVQAGLSSAAGSTAMGMNAASTTKTQTQALQANKTSSSSGGSGSGSGTPDMNTPISSNNPTLGSAMTGAAKVTMGVASAAVGVASAMGKEALGINTGGNTPNSSSNSSSKYHKKFPTEYKPSEEK